MERFLFVYHGAPGADSDTRHDLARWSAWFDGLGSRVIDRGSLTHSAVEIPRRLLGPKESASSLCGYSIVEATDFNEAVEIAGRCPIFDEEGSVELARLTMPLG